MAGSATGATVHATAVVEPQAKLGKDVQIGPYAIIGPDVTIGDGSRIHSHVVIGGWTDIGAGTEIFPFASIGLQPQDRKFAGEKSRLVIGERNVIREHVTMNPGTSGGGLITRVGDGGLYMVGVHVAHDCQVGNNVIMANNATLGGHVTVGDNAILGGLSAVHQFVRIGRHAIIGGMSGVFKDVIPYGSVKGERATLSGLNLIGMRRHEFPRARIDGLRQAYRTLFSSQIGTFQERLETVAGTAKDEDAVQELVEFIRAVSVRSICQPRTGSEPDAD